MADHSHLDDATYWRTRAKEMRALAQQADASHKDFLLGMAKEYERLAERADELAPVKCRYTQSGICANIAGFCLCKAGEFRAAEQP
jgi:hypothetical protein